MKKDIFHFVYLCTKKTNDFFQVIKIEFLLCFILYQILSFIIFSSNLNKSCR
jgi:hypothetical protein